MDRNNGIDFFRLVMSFFIVCVHAPFKGEGGKIVILFARCAVPFFFMITGYYYSKIKKIKQLIKICKLLVFSNLLYTLYNILIRQIQGNSLLENRYTIKDVWKILICNETPWGGHLWYIFALLYSYLFFDFFIYKISKKRLVSSMLIIIGLMLGQYSEFWSPWTLPNCLSRNWLFLGIPFMLLGYKVREQKVTNINVEIITISIILTSGFLVLEYVLLQILGATCNYAMYIMVTPLTICIFVFALNFYSYVDNRYMKFISNLGQKYSTGIYIFHILLLPLGYKLSDLFFNARYEAIIIFLITLFTVVVLEKVKVLMKEMI